MGVFRHVSKAGSRANDYLTFLRDLSTPWRAVGAENPDVAVKSTRRSKWTSCNNPSEKSRLPALTMLCFTVLWLLVSCGGEQPAPPVDTPIPEVPTETPSPTSTTPANSSPTVAATPTKAPEPAATEIVTHAASETSNGERGSDERVKVAVQQLFDTWTRALREDDAALFHSVLTREMAGSCGLDELQSWLDRDEGFLAEAVVATVFTDVNDPSRALAELVVGRPEESILFPWPVAREDGEWRAGFPVALTVRECPYAESGAPPGPEGGQPEYPQIPGLDLERREGILDAVPGTRVIRGNIRTGNSGSGFSSGGSMSPYDNQVNIHAEVETEYVAAELVRLYRDGLNHPSWNILDEGSSSEFGWFSWSVPDTEGRLWHGRLVVAPLHEGWKQVWLSLYSDDPDGGR